MSIQIIGDIGSCHMGKLEYALEAIDLAKESGLDIIKFQLFEGNLNGNIELPRKYWKEIVKHAKQVKIDIFASVFDEDAIQLLYDTGIKKIKLAYSQAFNLKLIRKAHKLDMKIWASGDADNYPYYADVKLYCIPQYPPKIMSNTFPIDSFNGMSSHFLGSCFDAQYFSLANKLSSVRPRWIYLEKHITLDHDDIDCPDHWFALTPKELKECVKEIKSLS